jgi:hypothetical protein
VLRNRTSLRSVDECLKLVIGYSGQVNAPERFGSRPAPGRSSPPRSTALSEWGIKRGESCASAQIAGALAAGSWGKAHHPEGASGRLLPSAKVCFLGGFPRSGGVYPPGNWFAPPDSNQSRRGGNETAEASGKRSTRRCDRPR